MVRAQECGGKKSINPEEGEGGKGKEKAYGEKNENGRSSRVSLIKEGRVFEGG